MNAILELKAELRKDVGTGAARALRRQGKVPAIVYGTGKSSLAIAIEEKEITKHYRKSGFTSTIIQIKIGTNQHKILPQAVELHPVTDIVRHVDFVYLNEKTQKISLAMVFEGKERALGVKRGGFFNIIKRTIMVLCDVNNIPKNIIIDVTNMLIGQSIKAKDIILPQGCQFIDQDDFIVATIIGRKGNKAEDEGAIS